MTVPGRVDTGCSGTMSSSYREEEVKHVIILLALLFVLLFFGLGFTAHFLWIVAAIVFFAWIIGLALGRGSEGRHHFYRW